MKLFKKTNRAYLIISTSVFLTAGAMIYFVLSLIIENQMNEKQLSDMTGIIRDIEQNRSAPDYYPFVEVREVQGQSERSIYTFDTLIYDVIEKENIPFRESSSVVSINGKKYLIVIRDTLLEKSDLLVTIAIVIASAFFLLLFSFYFINRKLSLNIWMPFYKTLDDLKNFSYENTGFKLSAVSEIDEFIELNKTLENLTQKVISDYQSLKRFTEDASHEIQSPLAVIQSKLESLLQNPGLKQDQVEAINAAYSSAIRISKLTQSLLLLTKIVNGQFPGKKVINLSELMEEKIELLSDFITEKLLVVEKNILPGCFLETDYFLAESMLLNLIGNSVKHCNTAGKININLDQNHLEISNTGAPLSVPPTKLFERFYKINTSSDSQGLGLSIVKEICILNRWEIKYKYENELHKVLVIF
jgi:signal transduction histidine kinase